MTEIEKIQRYVARTKMGRSERYCLTYCEAAELGRKARGNDDLLFEILVLMFNHGRAKGYRAAKAEMKKIPVCGNIHDNPELLEVTS